MKLIHIIFLAAALISSSFVFSSCGTSHGTYVGVSVHSPSPWGHHHHRGHHRSPARRGHRR